MSEPDSAHEGHMFQPDSARSPPGQIGHSPSRSPAHGIQRVADFMYILLCTVYFLYSLYFTVYNLQLIIYSLSFHNLTVLFIYDVCTIWNFVHFFRFARRVGFLINFIVTIEKFYFFIFSEHMDMELYLWNI